jgi:hypothetical protein
LAQCPEYFTLDLSNNRLGEKGLQYFVNAIESGEFSENLTLCFEGNNLTQAVVYRFAEALLSSQGMVRGLRVQFGYHLQNQLMDYLEKEVHIAEQVLEGLLNSPISGNTYPTSDGYFMRMVNGYAALAGALQDPKAQAEKLKKWEDAYVFYFDFQLRALSPAIDSLNWRRVGAKIDQLYDACQALWGVSQEHSARLQLLWYQFEMAYVALSEYAYNGAERGQLAAYTAHRQACAKQQGTEDKHLNKHHIYFLYREQQLNHKRVIGEITTREEGRARKRLNLTKTISPR